MEFREALQQLRERLDDSLIHHAKMTQRDDIGELYKLQAYSETHYYMKAVHDYTASEVEALLQFVDPLEVAYWCREENTHQVGLPICDLLKEIHADERFEKIAATMAAYRYTVDELMRDNLDEGVIDHLLAFEDPLKYLADRWPECSQYGEDVFENIKYDLINKDDRQIGSIHDRLKDAQRKAAEQPKSTRGDTARRDKESR